MSKLLCALSFVFMLVFAGQDGILFPYLNIFGGSICAWILLKTSKRLSDENNT